MRHRVIATNASGIRRVIKDEELKELPVGESSTLFIQEKGRAAWLWLHTEALAARLTSERLAKDFRPMIPRSGCGCQREWDDLLVAIPFRYDDQFAWSVEVHNAVNRKLGKPEMAIEQASAV